MKKCIGRSMRRSWIVLISFVLLYPLQPLFVFGSPILPGEVKRSFEGVFRWASFDTREEWIGEVPIVGTATFSLLEQTPVEGYEYLDYVQWGISVETFDGYLRFYGNLNNCDSYGTGPYPDVTAAILPWGPGNWDTGPTGDIEEVFSGLTWQAEPCSAMAGHSMSSNAWNLIDNSHFLPEQAYFWQLDTSHEYIAEVYIAYAPVPEPGTIFLVASGLLGLAGFARKWRH